MEQNQRRLAQFTVEGLFGLFDHTIPLNLEERITLVHAPNGYGKTVILKFISGFFGGSLAIFGQVEFRQIELLFSDGSSVAIKQDPPKAYPRRPPNQFALRRPYRIDYTDDFGTNRYDPEERDPSGRIGPPISTVALERYLPFISRFRPGEWHDSLVSDIISTDELLDRYWDRLPPSYRRSSPIPEWLDSVRESVHCRLIDTHRLFNNETRARSSRDEPMKPAVRTYSEELASDIQNLLASSVSFAQKLDQSFPNRVLERLRTSGPALPDEAIRQRLAELDKLRERLVSVGLLGSADEGALRSHDQLDEPTRRFLSEYIVDTSEKLNFYSPLLVKLELFLRIVNSRFQFKTVSISDKAGFVFTDINRQLLTPESLSSGEQHELVLIYELLFKTRKNTLILIDEPEISLHIAWEKRFLQDLDEIIKLTDIDALLSTHSPQIIGSRLNLAVQLQAPKSMQN
jgi:energy-coupling factor transporter ATP-binding protein EcfA2